MTISRGQMPRQLYGLGSLVKSVTKAAKKIVKSPIGKAAALYFAPMMFGQGAGLAGYKGLFGAGSLNPLKMLGTTLPGQASQFVASPFGKFMSSGLGKTLAITVPSVLAAAGVEEGEVEELKQDKEALTAALERGYKNLNPIGNRNPEEYEAEVAEFVRTYSAEGGRIGYAMGSPEENAIQASGIMGLPLNENPAKVTELDLRETGGFIPPVGVKEKADDIPPMLSNNEFVFTADAVRGMGEGDVNKGAERMYSMITHLNSFS